MLVYFKLTTLYSTNFSHHLTKTEPLKQQVIGLEEQEGRSLRFNNNNKNKNNFNTDIISCCFNFAQYFLKNCYIILIQLKHNKLL